MKQVFADTLYWVASITPGDPWQAPTLRAVAALGPAHVVTTEEVLVEFLSAYAGRGEYLRQKAVQTVRAILHAPHGIRGQSAFREFSGEMLYRFSSLGVKPDPGQRRPRGVERHVGPDGAGSIFINPSHKIGDSADPRGSRRRDFQLIGGQPP